LRKIRIGGIAITCKSKEEIQDVNNEAKNKLLTDVITKIPELRKRRRRIFDMEEQIDQETI